jgi:hypothetical protein
MGIGLVLGGAADGFRKQQKHMADMADEQAKRRARDRDEQYQLSQVGVKLPGEGLPAGFDPYAAPEPVPDPSGRKQSFMGKLLGGLDHKAAAAKAGLQIPQPAMAGGQMGGDAEVKPGAAPAPAPAGGTELAPVDVDYKTPLQTASGTALQQMALARKYGKDITPYLEQYQKASRDEANQELSLKGMTMPGLADMFEHYTGKDVDYEPTTGGKFKVTIGGDEAGEMTVDQMRSQLTEFVNKTPGYAEEMQLKRDQSTRQALTASAQARTSMAQAQAALAHADAAQTNARTNQAELGLHTQEAARKAAERAELGKIAELDPVADAGTIRETIARLGSDANYKIPEYGPDGTIVGYKAGNYLRDHYDAMRQARMAS